MAQKARHPGVVTDLGEATRPVIAESWRRSLAARVDPDRHEAPVVYAPDEIADLRGTHPLATTVPLLRHTLSMDDTIMIVTDTRGHILWCEGDNGVRHKAERVHLTEGSRWSEDAIGTNAMGTALATGKPVTVHSREHLVRTYHGWTCAASPVHDPHSGLLLGVVDVSGPLRTMHPAVAQLVSAAATLAEHHLRQHLVRREHVLTLNFLGGPHADLDGRPLVLTLRNAEVLTALALHPKGLTAEQLALLLYGERGNPTTVRAELHRLRAQLGGVLLTRPYRLDAVVRGDFLDVRTALRSGDARRATRHYSGDLLPRSDAPVVREERADLAAAVRRGVLDTGDVDSLLSFADSAEDAEVLERLHLMLPVTDPRHALVSSRLRRALE
ncbi:GAF domain-containing protein [Lentzea atacamensis]|uniref:GAF domain-containing protein n=1 Tax=Lentzea atacamensis TaxID=531938 RepID=A0ABX9EHC0_9PSEU|nr:GAF domain-containing protein [Lentzea atacamensis]RAS70590.1 GAF domain-containing protein [Lentzea atacamensis]